MMSVRGSKSYYKLFLGLVVLLFTMKIFDGSGLSAPAKDWRIAIATAPVGGSVYHIGAGIANVLQLKGVVSAATAEATAGAVEDIRLLGAGKVALAVCSSNWIAAAAQGEKPFEKKYDLRMVIPVQAGQFFFVTLRNSPFNSISDLRGKRVAVGPRGSGMDQHAQTILRVLGMSYKDIQPIYLDFAEGGTALREGNVHAQLQDGLPNAAMKELSELADIKLIKFSEEEIKRLTDAAPYSRIFLEKDVFRGVTERTPTIGSPGLLITTASADPELIYVVTKCIIENADEMNRKAPACVANTFLEMAKENPRVLEAGAVPLHPGAYRAFKEAGFLK